MNFKESSLGMKLTCPVGLNEIGDAALTSKQIQSLILFVLEFKQKYEQGFPENISNKPFEALQLIADANKTQDWELDFTVLEKIVRMLSQKSDGQSIWMLMAASITLTSLYKDEAYAEKLCLSLISSDCSEDFLKETLENLELKNLTNDVSYELRYILQNVLSLRLKQILAEQSKTSISSFDGVPNSWVIKMLDDLKSKKVEATF